MPIFQSTRLALFAGFLALVRPAGTHAAGPGDRTNLRAAKASPDAMAVLQARCVRCHGAEEKSGGLRLDSYSAILRGGDRGPVVVPGDAKASLLMQKVLRRDKPAMPPRKPLSTAEIRTLRAWIDAGAMAQSQP